MTAAAEYADRQRGAPEMIGNLRQLAAHWALIAVPLILSRLMISIISFVKMLRTLGWFDGFIALRLHNGMISRTTAFPIAVTLQPFVRRIAGLPAEMGPPKQALPYWQCAQLSGLSSRGSPPFTALQRDFDYRPDNP